MNSLRQDIRWSLIALFVAALTLGLLIVLTNRDRKMATLVLRAEMTQALENGASRLRNHVDSQMQLMESRNQLDPTKRVDGSQAQIELYQLEAILGREASSIAEIIEFWKANRDLVSDSPELIGLIENHLDLLVASEPGNDFPVDDTDPSYRVTPTFLRSFFRYDTSRSNFRDKYYQGVELGNAGEVDQAIQAYLEVEKHRPDSVTELYLQIFNQIRLIDFEVGHAPIRLYYVLYLLYEFDEVSLEPSKIEFIETKLRQRFPEFDRYQAASDSLWKTARLIETVAQQMGDEPQSLIIDEQHLLIVSEGKVAALLNFELSDFLESSNVEVHYAQKLPAEPPQIYLQILKNSEESGYLLISSAIFNDALKGLRNRQLITNILYLLTIGVMVACLGYLYVLDLRSREIEQLRARFVSTVSHELRTPLTLIKMFSETLVLKRVPEENRTEYLNTILAETDRMTGLVNNIIDYSKQTKNVQNLQMSANSLSELCHCVANTFRYRFEVEDVDFSVEVEEGIEAWIDIQAFQQVIFNLIDNAIKYTVETKVIKLRLTKLNGIAELSIMDNGIGVSDQFKETVFEEFFRVNNEHVSAQRGSGIGLSVVKKTLEAMNCSIAITDHSAAGSNFIITIPLIDYEH